MLIRGAPSDATPSLPLREPRQPTPPAPVTVRPPASTAVGNSGNAALAGIAATFEFVAPTVKPPARVAPPVRRQPALSIDHFRHPDVLLPLVAAFLVLVLLLAWAP